MDRLIRIKFVEGCLSNISKNESVAISLRLLPKLFQSFQNFRGMDTHEVSMFAERRHNMMKLFFDNLKTYTENYKSGVECPFFNHLAQIQVRLQFLSVIFSVQVSYHLQLHIASMPLYTGKIKVRDTWVFSFRTSNLDQS